MSRPVNRRAKGVDGVVSAKKDSVPTNEITPQSDQIIRIDTKESFENLVVKESEALKDYIRQWLHNVHDEEEAVQNVFAYMWEYRKALTFKSMNMLYRYLNMTARSHALNMLKERSHHKKYLNHVFYSDTPYADSPDEIIEMEQTGDVIQNVLEQMPYVRSTVYDLRHNQELGYEEIAERLGISQVMARKHFSLAMKEIKDALSSLE